jgi:inactivated superfamily I helicase
MANRLEERLAQAKAARNNRTTEYKTLSERYSATMKELKGTREQRITKIEDAETILDVIKSLQEADVAARLGRHQELIKIAVDRESERLSQHHKYDDGIIDQPLLTPENAL